MLSYTSDFSDGIRATTREMLGYIKIADSVYFSGDDGLISFAVTSTAMSDDHFCMSSVIASQCEFKAKNLATKYSSILKGNYFDAYVGVPGITDFSTALETSATVSSGSYTFSLSEQNTLAAIADGATVRITVKSAKSTGVWSSSSGYSFVAGTDSSGNFITYTVTPTRLAVTNGTDGTYSVKVEVKTDEVKCLGRFYTEKVVKNGTETTVTGYDIVSKLDVPYEPTVTASSSGYEVIDILNDIVDQTGINEGTYYTSTGSGIYIETIVGGTCREQFGWLMALCDNYGSIFTGSRTNLGYIEGKSYNDGSTYYSDYDAVDDTLIYMDGIDIDEDTFTISSLTTGTDSVPITLGSGDGINNYNPYIDSTQATVIYNNLYGVTYMPMTMRFRGDPCVELMDSLKVTHDSTDYRCVVMKITSTFNGGFEQTIECFGDSEDYYNSSSGAIGKKVDSIADHIIFEGLVAVSGTTWYVRKWNNGRCDCWCRKTLSSRAVTTADGNLYRSAATSALTYPVTFSAVPHERVSMPGSSTTSCGVGFVSPAGGTTGPTTTTSGQYYIYSPTSTTANYVIEYRVFGKL